MLLYGLGVLSGNIFPLLLSLEFSSLLEFLGHLLLFLFQGLGRDFFLGSSFGRFDTANKSMIWHLLCSEGNLASCSLLLFRLIDVFGLSSCLSLGFSNLVLLCHQFCICAFGFGTCEGGDRLGSGSLGFLINESSGLKVCGFLGLFFEGRAIQLGSEITLTLWRCWSCDDKCWKFWCRSRLCDWLQEDLGLDNKLNLLLGILHQFLLQCLGDGSNKSSWLIKNSS